MDPRKLKRATSVRPIKQSKAQWGAVGLTLTLAKTSMLQKMGKVEATVSSFFVSSLYFLSSDLWVSIYFFPRYFHIFILLVVFFSWHWVLIKAIIWSNEHIFILIKYIYFSVIMLKEIHICSCGQQQTQQISPILLW